MKIKKEYFILGALIAALAVYLSQRSGDRTQYTLPAVPALAAADITKIQITRPDQTLTLVRQEGRWVLEPQGFRVDPTLGGEILETVAGLKLTALVAESRSFSLYELDDEHKAAVKAWQSDQLRREFEVGKAAPSYRHTFVRLAGDDRVFHGQDNFSFRFRTPVEDMRDKSVLAFDRKDIREIRIDRAGQALTLKRLEPPKEEPPSGSPPPAAPPAPVWQASDGRSADAAAVEDLLLTLSALSCSRYLADQEIARLGAPLAAITLKGPQEHTLSIYAPAAAEDKSHPAVSSAAEGPFLLSEDIAQRLTKDPAALFKP